MLDDEYAVILAAAQIVSTEAAVAALEDALVATLQPLLLDAVRDLTTRLATLEARLSRLEHTPE